ncbi:MAG: DUF2283 domain-containing protein [Nanoarchaeota archaeon]
MKRYYDENADIFWLVIKEGPQYDTEEVLPDVNLELGKDNEVIGVEILRASRFGKDLKKIAEIVSQ